MKKLFFLPLCIFLYFFTVNAQIKEDKVKYNKADRPAVIGEFKFTPELIENTVLKDLKEKGFKKYDHKKGYYIFKGISFSQISEEKVDFYFSVEKKKKEKDNEITVLTFMVSKGYENFVSSLTDKKMIDNTINYMNSLLPEFIHQKLEKDIEEQKLIIKKLEFDFDNITKLGEKLREEKKEIEQQIEQNKNDQEKLKLQLVKERLILENLEKQIKQNEKEKY